MRPANLSDGSSFSRCSWSTTNVVSDAHIASSLPTTGSARLPFAFSTFAAGDRAIMRPSGSTTTKDRYGASKPTTKKP
jgi:hypothetical protein